jgi:hypothetical protein
VIDPFCSEESRAEQAQLAGTATRADAWLLVEHHGPWAARAIEDNDLPAATQAWLEVQVEALGAALGKVRPLFVRPFERARAGLACMLAIAQQDRRELYRLSVTDHAELAGLDLAAMLRGGALAGSRSGEPLTLVCGNARRDRCCARWGPATLRALAEQGEEGGWLSTHQGGHRYAATGLWLPEGVAYGFLAPAEAAALVEARRQGRLHLRCFRGRTFHPPPVQAADAMLREARGETALDPWLLAEAVEEPPGRWRVVFAEGARRHAVRLQRGSEEALVSCTPAKRQRIDRFELESIASDG